MKKTYLLIAWAITCFLFFEVAAHAQESHEAAKSTGGQLIARQLDQERHCDIVASPDVEAGWQKE